MSASPGSENAQDSSHLLASSASKPERSHDFCISEHKEKTTLSSSFGQEEQRHHSHEPIETFSGLDVYGYHTQTKRMSWGIRYHTRFSNSYSHHMTNVFLKILLNGCLLCQ